MNSHVKKEVLSSPHEFIKFSPRREKGESGQHNAFLRFPCSVVLPEILGNLSVINRTSVEFSRKRVVEESKCYKRTVKKKCGSDLVWSRTVVGVDSLSFDLKWQVTLLFSG